LVSREYFLQVALDRPTKQQFRKLIGVANYQFGKGAGAALFDKGIRIACSKRTGRIRHIYRKSKLIATLRPKEGSFALTVRGAEILLTKFESFPNVVVAQNDVAEFIEVGGDVFAKHVVRATISLRPGEEVIVTGEDGHLMGVGRTLLSGNDIEHFKRGVAVKVRKGVEESTVREESASADGP
jgi:predicted RNA-binding protein (TIGR00451 family)